MAVRKILVYGNPLLREKAQPVEEINGALQALIEDLAETMQAARGLGLAANQIGVLKRLFVVDFSGRENLPRGLLVFLPGRAT